MSNYKIIFTGPVGAGKTTAISSLSDIPVLGTDEMASDMTVHRKQTTTVAMDYGLMKLDAGERIHLYGTPGQERFLGWCYCWITVALTLSRICVFLSIHLRISLPRPILLLELRAWIWGRHQAWMIITMS